jgi:UDP-N-acetylmuramyl pentapeptide phosphotransferase/UDP-N-acetylglucosamine-1-phosphate transferase
MNRYHKNWKINKQVLIIKVNGNPKKKRYTFGQKMLRVVPRIFIFLFLSFFLMIIVLLGTEDYFFDLEEKQRLAMLSALAGVAFYMTFKTIDNPDWSVRRQLITSVRYMFYFIIFFIGLNLILLVMSALQHLF